MFWWDEGNFAETKWRLQKQILFSFIKFPNCDLVKFQEKKKKLDVRKSSNQNTAHGRYGSHLEPFEALDGYPDQMPEQCCLSQALLSLPVS